MRPMSTQHLRLHHFSDGYYRTSWVDDAGKHQGKSFGKNRTKAQNRFAAFHLRWKTDPRVKTPSLPGPPTVRAIWERFEKHADAYYKRKDGRPTGEANNFRDAFRVPLALFGEIPAPEFRPTALKAVQRKMVTDGLCRNVINARVRKIRQVFKWAVSEEMIAGSVHHALTTVSALKRGRGIIIDGVEVIPVESEEVKPVPEQWVEDVCRHVPPTVEAMIRFQYWTGARPDEVCRISAVEIDRGGPIWLYKPEHHKTAHHGKTRTVAIGPRAQKVIEPFMTRDLHAPIFSPAEALQQRNAAHVEAYAADGPDYRKWQSYQKRERKPRKVADRYNPRAYARIIARVCKKFEIPHWHPNQLRHNAGTRVRKHFGLEGVKAVLGQTKTSTAELYAEIDPLKAAAAMEAVG